MTDKIRAFIALELPPSVISLLDKLQQDFKSLKLRAKWVRPENIHLTLKFLGDIHSGDIEQIDAALSDTAKVFTPIVLSVRGVGVFPGIRRPRVVWAGIGGQIQLLVELQRKLEDNLAVMGFAPEKRPFKGHLTLGRFKGAVNPNTVRRIIREYADLDGDEFTADRIILFRSELKPSGAVYSELKWAVL